MARMKFQVDNGPDIEDRIADGDGRTQEPEFRDPTADIPDENAPEINTLEELISGDGDLLKPRRVYLRTRRAWAWLKPWDVELKRKWAALAFGKDENRTAKDDMVEQSIALSLWNNKTGELMGEKAAATFRKVHPDTFAELWEHVAEMNVLRVKDMEKLKNSSGGTIGSAAPPSSPENSEQRPSLVT